MPLIWVVTSQTASLCPGNNKPATKYQSNRQLLSPTENTDANYQDNKTASSVWMMTAAPYQVNKTAGMSSLVFSERSDMRPSPDKNRQLPAGICFF
jgi:hypothetical protein